MRRAAAFLLAVACLIEAAPGRADEPASAPADTKDLAATFVPWAMPTQPAWLARSWRFAGTLGIVSFPHVINVEALAEYARPSNHRWDLFAVGLEFGYLPPGLGNYGGPPPKDTDTLSIVHLGVQARWYPWRFVFVGANVGWQSWRDDATHFGDTFRYVTYSTFVTPRIGVLYRWKSTRWVFGADAGLTFRLSHSTDASPYAGDTAARMLSDGFGLVFIPEVTVLRVGYTL